MQKPSAHLRRATIEDATLLAELGALTFFQTFAAHNTDEDMTEYLASSFNRDKQQEELSDEQTTFLIANVDERAAGYAMLRAGTPPNDIDAVNSIELVRLYVKKEFHGRGVGKSLMQACFDEARKMGYEDLWLGVWENNARARAFYRKWKFEEFGEHIFQLGGDAQNDFLMRRSLSDEL